MFFGRKVEKLRYDFLLIFAVNMGLTDVIWEDVSKMRVEMVVRHMGVEKVPDMNF